MKIKIVFNHIFICTALVLGAASTVVSQNCYGAEWTSYHFFIGEKGVAPESVPHAAPVSQHSFFLPEIGWATDYSKVKLSYASLLVGRALKPYSWVRLGVIKNQTDIYAYTMIQSPLRSKCAASLWNFYVISPFSKNTTRFSSEARSQTKNMVCLGSSVQLRRHIKFFYRLHVNSCQPLGQQLTISYQLGRPQEIAAIPNLLCDSLAASVEMKEVLSDNVSSSYEKSDTGASAFPLGVVKAEPEPSSLILRKSRPILSQAQLDRVKHLKTRTPCSTTAQFMRFELASNTNRVGSESADNKKNLLNKAEFVRRCFYDDAIEGHLLSIPLRHRPKLIALQEIDYLSTPLRYRPCGL